MRNKSILLLLLASFLVSGCVSIHTEIFVKKDGSGTITETLYYTKGMLDMMAGMGEMTGKQGNENNDFLAEEMSEANMLSKAKELGDGVVFKSVKRSQTDDGSMKGYISYFEFSDVTKLKLESSVENPEAETDQTGAGNKKESEALAKFAFKKGNPAELIIHIPKDKDEQTIGNSKSKDNDQTPPDSKITEMMLSMFDGMKVGISLKFEGKIKKTNATYMNAEKNGITLFDMDFGKLVKDLYQKGEDMPDIKDINDLETARRLFEKYPYMKFEINEEVSVRF